MMRRVFACACAFLLLVLSGCDAFVGTAQHVERGRVALDAGETGRASIELQKALKRNPENAEARFLLARLALMTGDVQEGVRELQRAITSGYKGPAVDALQVQVWLAANQPQALVDAFAKGTIEMPEPARSIALARAYNALGQPDRTIDTLMHMPGGKSLPAAARLVQAEALTLRGDSDRALDELTAMLREDPRSFEASLMKGMILVRRGQFAAAEAALREARSQMGRDTPLTQQARALGGIVEACLAQGRIAEAVQAQDDLTKMVPDSVFTRMLSARIKLARGDYSGGVSDLQRIVAGASDYLPARMLLGAAQLTQGNLLQAEAQLSVVVQRASDNVEARKLLARVRLDLNQPDAALRTLTPALEGDASDPQLYALLGRARLSSGNSDAAVETLERGVRANPSNTALRLDLGQAYLIAGRTKEALETLKPGAGTDGDARHDVLFIKALNAERGARGSRDEIDKRVGEQPKSVPTLNLGALFFASRWEFERTRNLLAQALAIDPRNVASLINLARVAVATGDLPTAESSLRAALAVDESSTTVRIALSDLLTRRGAYADAKQLLDAGIAKAQSTGGGADIRFALGQLQLVRGDLPGANAVFDSLVAAAPERAELVNQIGVLLLDAHQYDAALARFRKASEIAPKQALYWINTGRAQLALDHSVPARESLEKALGLQPASVPAVAALALIDVRARKFDAALARVDALRSTRPDDVAVLVLRGDVQAAADASLEADESYSSALRRRPDAAVAVKLYQVRRTGSLPKPAEPLQQWLALQPSDFRVRLVLADFYLSQNALKEAASELQQVIEQIPSNAVALNNLAWTYLKLGDARAESVAERAYKIAGKSGAVADTFGWILAGRRATERALPLLEQASRAAPADPEVQYHYAYVLAQAGRRGEARDVLSRALGAGRDFPARQEAERLLADLKV